MAHRRRPRKTPKFRAAAAGLVLALFVGGAGSASAQVDVEFTPGFGLIYGEGRTENGTETTRFGFSSRRLQENDRSGSLALVGEKNDNGVPFEVVDKRLAADAVKLEYRTLYVELKRYFALGARFHLYWGLRGGVTRITGTIDHGPQQPVETFEEEQAAPLVLLALPLALENPGFLLLALADGTSAGLTLDLVPGRVWLDYQVGATLIPRHRGPAIAIDEPFVVTQTLQLVVVF